MSKLSTMYLVALTVAIASALTGCGDSTPLASSQPPAAQSAPKAPPGPAMPAEVGAFAVVKPAGSEVNKGARISPDCNLDSIDGKPVGDEGVDHAAKPMFSGWAADTLTGQVPTTGRLLLEGAGEKFAVEFHTGNPKREDVADAMKKPAFVDAGYEINGDLSKVPMGSYSVALAYAVAGQQLVCNTGKKISVE